MATPEYVSYEMQTNIVRLAQANLLKKHYDHESMKVCLLFHGLFFLGLLTLLALSCFLN